MRYSYHDPTTRLYGNEHAFCDWLIKGNSGDGIHNFAKCLSLVAICYSLTDVKNEACRALCVRDGYSSGKSTKTGCACIDEKPSYQNYITRTMKLPYKHGRLEVVLPQQSYDEE